MSETNFARQFEREHEYVRPKRKRNPYETRQKSTKTREPKNESKRFEISVNEKNKLIFGIIMFGLMAICIVFFAAYTSSVAYSNEIKKTEIAELQGEVDYLTIQLEAENNVKKIEDYAFEELGMIYPSDSQTIQLTGEVEATQTAEK